MRITKEQIEAEIGKREIYHDDRKWLTANKVAKGYPFAIIYGDDSDVFIKEAADDKDLISKLKAHIDGDTNCDYETQIYIVIRNGESCQPSEVLTKPRKKLNGNKR